MLTSASRMSTGLTLDSEPDGPREPIRSFDFHIADTTHAGKNAEKNDPSRARVIARRRTRKKRKENSRVTDPVFSLATEHTTSVRVRPNHSASRERYSTAYAISIITEERDTWRLQKKADCASCSLAYTHLRLQSHYCTARKENTP